MSNNVHCHLVFKSPVWSSFLVLRGLNQSAFFQKLKRPDQTAKRLQTAVFCGL
ncbi:hypothetical protein K443DRAFT_90377 [Laccaria amethystina LaAM-08-1]|uniref:Uncharacterized protein n=1 Tax=Laccaria amethystina LaAM-08-1 TaxID=1095629 RepID=A0A0C9Y6X4_9AGAR|nr:hypothetical protein K443DRAFT_90377 [Laccaria amethystina LaAM-08-1]